MKISLVHEEKAGNFITYKVQKLPVTLGREVDNDIAVSDKSVSRMHAEIFLKKNKLMNNSEEEEDMFFVSDYTDYFKKIAGMFFDSELNLTKADIWS